MTDAAKAFDKTCVLNPGDHELVTKESAVYYDLAEIVSVSSLRARIKNRTARVGPPATPELMVRIRQGAIDSWQTADNVIQAIQRCPWKPPK